MKNEPRPTFAILILPSAQRELDRLPARVQAQIDHHIRALASDPQPANSQTLSGSQFKGLRKIRSGDYRIVYQVRHAQVVIVIVMIGNRKEIYDLLRRHLP